MIFRNLDENHDWTFGRGKQNFAARQKAIGLNVKTRLLSWVGDCFFAQSAGVDWLNRLGNKNQRNLLELDLRRVISQSRDVTAIKSFDSNLNGRNFDARYSILTVYSQEFQDTLTVEA